MLAALLNWNAMPSRVRCGGLVGLLTRPQYPRARTCVFNRANNNTITYLVPLYIVVGRAIRRSGSPLPDARIRVRDVDGAGRDAAVR